MGNSSLPDWTDALIEEGENIENAVRCLNAAAIQIALVVNGRGELVGTITDGDIRRGLLRGLTLQSPVADITHREPLVVPPGLRREMVMQLMRANRIHQLPVVDEQRRLLGLHLWDEFPGPTERSNLMVVMAGGFGKRMKPHTLTCPKPMLPVAGKPMVENILDRAKAVGFNRFLLTLHYLGHVVEDYFGDGSRFGINVSYVREERPLGTAGALQLISPRPAEPIVVTNGDVLTDINYSELLDFHLRNKASATMAVRIHEWQHPFGVVQTKGLEIIGFEEKPIYRSHVNAGVYVIEPDILDMLPQGVPCDMPELFEATRQAGKRTIVYPMHEPWLDIGRPSDYEQASGDVQQIGTLV